MIHTNIRPFVLEISGMDGYTDRRTDVRDPPVGTYKIMCLFLFSCQIVCLCTWAYIYLFI